ncbi:aminopeptidase N [Sneathiella glossodoripedis]|uniref:aminopeptidase N n=1 Tax=Sneathiella glossodoripedis TaxID=418853 RepID=UPI00056D6945|nr:aminopeptidase N [Sneathiella glossodoripedis]
MSLSKAAPKTIYLKDYTPPAFTITHVDLVIELDEHVTKVSSSLKIKRQTDNGNLVYLDGEKLDLQSITLDGTLLDQQNYTLSSTGLTFAAPADEFTVEIVTLIKPQDNTELEGLYKSSGNFCTQCEAEGFRKITYYMDRPDVMARFTTKIVGDGTKYPVKLSNGNLMESGHLDDGRQYNLWVDPFPKPAYLFALVAGDLAVVEDHFVTQSGRQIKLQIFVEKGNEDKCDHAMTSLKKSMKWDEEKYGREYDLDIFMIVAVSDFNMGAMENKGLNVFNSKYVLASKETATDADFDGIESVIAHEYFHNWTGNRITCRDWFQLTLKEGLTVFRDQQFSADMNSAAVKRIEDVQRLRAAQFPEDAGPLAHPIQPQSYVEINNFYTATVYEKGAEVIRMAHTILGEENFRKGMDLYFERHDGQAVTTEEFIKALEDGSETDLSQFRNWYIQAGTPEISITDDYDEKSGSYTLRIRQDNPKAGKNAPPLHIPLKIGLLGSNGEDLIPGLDGSGTELINLKKEVEEISFHGLKERPTPSLFRGFSAPVRLRASPADDKLVTLFKNDTDLFNRWEAGQRLATQRLLQLITEKGANRLAEDFIGAFGDLLADASLEPAYKAITMSLPGEQFIGQQMSVVDVDGIHNARKEAIKTIGATYSDELMAIYEQHQNQDHNGDRSLKNMALLYLSGTEDPSILKMAREQYLTATNMTDRISALSRLVVTNHPARDECLEDFYNRWENDSLVIDKWFTLQATSSRDAALEDVSKLLGHPAFTYTNPNRVRSLIAAFASANPRHFHSRTGAGYQFLTDAIIKLNGINPQIAARLVSPLGQWRRYDDDRQTKMKDALKAILNTENISNDVYEMASKSLGDG